jgi:hypothetical protein
MTRWVLYLFCFEILCFSGGQRFYVENNLPTLVVWLLTCGGIFIISEVQSEREFDWVGWLKGSFPVFVLMLWTLLSTIVVNEVADFSYLSYILFPLGMLFSLCCFDFHRVRDCLLKLLSWLMAVSIVVHIGSNADILPAELIDDGEKVVSMSLYFFNVGWGELDFLPMARFSSIYWEPGQCQIIIMYVLVLFTDDIQQHLYDILYLIRRYGILVLAILLTGSTTGYLVFALFVCCILLFNGNVLSQRKILPFFFSAILAVGVFSFFYLSDVVQSKLEQSDSLSDENSFAIRMADNLACFTVAVENPVFGLGVNSDALNADLSTFGNTTASNGWLFSAAQMGFVYIGIMFMAMYLTIRKMHLGMLAFLPLLILILSQANEYATFFPVMWLYCCPISVITSAAEQLSVNSTGSKPVNSR